MHYSNSHSNMDESKNSNAGEQVPPRPSFRFSWRTFRQENTKLQWGAGGLLPAGALGALKPSLTAERGSAPNFADTRASRFQLFNF
jgi:hypothetical protein